MGVIPEKSTPWAVQYRVRNKKKTTR